jgi:hypothetical protein
MSRARLDAVESESVPVDVLDVPQLVAAGSVEGRPMFPSFLYLPHDDELAPSDRDLPWVGGQPFVTGEFARSLGAKTPIRLVSSAKSWLCHPGIDRKAPVLPVDAPEDLQQVSPLSATIRYLEHLRQAWDHLHPDAPLAQQDVVLTVPASFDPAARELTAEAAEAAGIGHAVLLEEPQAALYSWIQSSAGAWRQAVNVGDVILVVDVGGGTTDLSLMAVTEEAGSLQLTRIAVGSHILLGGDNMDLALAHVVKAKMAAKGVNLEPWQVQALTHACRKAKETLLSDKTLESCPLVVPSRGSRLIGGTLRTELTQSEVTETVVSGFFPEVDSTARPVARPRGALTRLGLPYAQDAAITRHLAAFLGDQGHATSELPGFTPSRGSFLHPTALLFNGGVFKADALKDRLVTLMNSWLAAEGAAPVRVLAGTDLDLAVARGAAYYGSVRRGRGVRIRGGTAKSFYAGIETAMPAVPGVEPPIHALCIAPFGMEEGTEGRPSTTEFGLVVGEPVRFRFFGSSVRREDTEGTVIEDPAAGELVELDPIEATLPAEGKVAGDVIPVRLRAAITEIGTLRLEAVPRSGGAPWKVEFNVRGEG